MVYIKSYNSSKYQGSAPLLFDRNQNKVFGEWRMTKLVKNEDSDGEEISDDSAENGIRVEVVKVDTTEK